MRARVADHTSDACDLDLQPLAGRIGAVVSGVEIGAGMSPGALDAIDAAVARYGVVFLRGQDLDYASQAAFAEAFGPLSPGHPIFPTPKDTPHLRAFDAKTGIRANYWHSDLTFLPDPPALAFLRSVVVPDTGGDTMWASGTAAFRDMPSALQAFALSLDIIHSNNCDYIDATMGNGRSGYVSTPFEARHPAVAAHPSTGEPYLLVGGFAQRVDGYGPDESRAILALLKHYLGRPENTVRWTWRPGDLAIWDNLATQHYAVHDYGDADRLNERIMTSGPPPKPFRDHVPSKTNRGTG